MTECSDLTDILHNVYMLDIRYILNYIKYSQMNSIYIKVGNNIIYIYIYIYISTDNSIHLTTNVITCARLRLKQMWRLMTAKTEMKREH